LFCVSIGFGIVLLLNAIPIPFAIVQLPADDLVNDQRKTWLNPQPAPVCTRYPIVKNALRLVLVMLGMIMLIPPGWIAVFA
jgi:hypothetical protein